MLHIFLGEYLSAWIALEVFDAFWVPHPQCLEGADFPPMLGYDSHISLADRNISQP
jgi:hypothetical protein